MPVFEASVPLNCTREAIFEFLVRPANVLRILPPNSGMTFQSAPERLQLGSRLEFSIEGMGPIQRMLHEVTHFVEPLRFVETQLKGPLRSWQHDHRLEPDGDGVLVVDRIEFEPPGGLLGFIVTEEKIQEMLQAGFAHRHAALRQLCADGTL
jgi:ligand-binding SRPBCC domain-containing protein